MPGMFFSLGRLRSDRPDGSRLRRPRQHVHVRLLQRCFHGAAARLRACRSVQGDLACCGVELIRTGHRFVCGRGVHAIPTDLVSRRHRKRGRKHTTKQSPPQLGCREVSQRLLVLPRTSTVGSLAGDSLGKRTVVIRTAQRCLRSRPRRRFALRFPTASTVWCDI